MASLPSVAIAVHKAAFALRFAANVILK